MSDIIIRDGKPEDAKSTMNLIRELAEYVECLDRVVIDEHTILQDGFGHNPVFFLKVAEYQSEIIGISLSYTRFSTWYGKCLYLEDLVVKEAFRKRGVGRMLFETTMDLCLELNYSMLIWQVAKINTEAMKFYETFNSIRETGWHNYYLPQNLIEEMRRK